MPATMARRNKRRSRQTRSVHRTEHTLVAMRGLHDLPNELLYLIREFLPLEDLRDHIAFQGSCKRVRALYACDEKFWKAACNAYGVTRPMPCDDFPYTARKVTWRELAIVIVNHQECCSHRSCQKYILPEFQDLGTKVRQATEILKNEHKFVGFRTSIHLTTRVFSDIAAPEDYDSEGGVSNLAEQGEVVLHSPGMCKFATAPPMQDLCVNALGFRLYVKNFDGVTVWDVLDRLDQFRWEHFSPSRFVIAYETHQNRLPSLAEFDWIHTLTFGDLAPYIADILDNSGPIWELEHVFTQLHGHADELNNIDRQTSAWRVVVNFEEIFDRCRLKDFVRYLGRRFPKFMHQSWYHSLIEFSPVEHMLRQLTFEGLEECTRDVDRPDSVEFNSLWKRKE